MSLAEQSGNKKKQGHMEGIYEKSEHPANFRLRRVNIKYMPEHHEENKYELQVVPFKDPVGNNLHRAAPPF